MVFPELLGSAMVEELCDKVRYINICTYILTYIHIHTLLSVMVEVRCEKVRAALLDAIYIRGYVYVYVYLYMYK